MSEGHVHGETVKTKKSKRGETAMATAMLEMAIDMVQKGKKT